MPNYPEQLYEFQKMKGKNFAVVIPCYNEGKRLDTKTFAEFIAGHPQIKFILSMTEAAITQLKS